MEFEQPGKKQKTITIEKDVTPLNKLVAILKNRGQKNRGQVFILDTKPENDILLICCISYTPWIRGGPLVLEKNLRQLMAQSDNSWFWENDSWL